MNFLRETMTETIIVAMVSFFASVVVFSTAVIGYLKVLKPMREMAKAEGGKFDSLDTSMKNYERRLATIRETAEAAQSAAESFKLHAQACDMDRNRLSDEIEELKRRNDKLQEMLTKGA
mgnify:CR=1 FL=1